MFERILLPLDGSEIAEMALQYGEELARSLGSELVLFHVRAQDGRQEYEHVEQTYLERLAETVERNVGNGRQQGQKIKVVTKLATGEPTQNICNLAASNDINLVIMAAVSASGLKIGKMLGSVTDHVCRTVPIPMMLIRPQKIKQNDSKTRLIDQILVPVDGSDLSKLALPSGEELAQKLRAGLTLFQMATRIRPFDDPSGILASVDYTNLNENEENRVRAEMLGLENELRGKGVNTTNVVTSGFDAADEIIETSRNIRADLVVMSTRGRSGLGRWVYGNVAEKVLRHGETPLLLINAKAG